MVTFSSCFRLPASQVSAFSQVSCHVDFGRGQEALAFNVHGHLSKADDSPCFQCDVKPVKHVSQAHLNLTILTFEVHVYIHTINTVHTSPSTQADNEIAEQGGYEVGCDLVILIER